MGYTLLFESMLPSVLYARDKYLKDDGQIYPNKAMMYICALTEDEEEELNDNFNWSNVYGFDMSIMNNNQVVEQKNQFKKKVEIINKNRLNSNIYKFIEFNIKTMSNNDLDFTCNFQLQIKNLNKNIHSFAIYFDTLFEHDNATTSINLSTSFLTKATHWKQTIFDLDPIIKIPAADETSSNDEIDQIITGTIIMERNKDNNREYNVTLMHQYKDCPYFNKYRIEM